MYATGAARSTLNEEWENFVSTTYSNIKYSQLLQLVVIYDALNTTQIFSLAE